MDVNRSGRERSEHQSGAIQPFPLLSTMSLCYGPSKSAIDQIVRSCGVLAGPPRSDSLAGISKATDSTDTTSIPIRVFAVAPHVYRTEMAQRVASDMGLTMEQFAQLANPIYPGIPGMFLTPARLHFRD